MENYFLNLRTAKAQADGCAKSWSANELHVVKFWASHGQHGVKSWLTRGFVLLGLLFSLAIGQMWGADASSATFIYDNTASNWSDVQLMIGHGSYSSVYGMTNISNTKLYYLTNFSWGGYTEFYFVTGCSGWGNEGNSPTHRKDYASGYSAKMTTNVGSNKYKFVSSGSSNGSSVTATSISAYTELNYTQTLNQTLSTDGGSTYSASTAAIATVKVSSYKLTSFTASSSNSGTISSGSSSTSCTAAQSATVTYTVSNVATGYTFVGWYDGSTQKSTSTTYTYNATGAKTITARFKENTYTVTVAKSPAAGGSITPTSATAMPQITGGAITATPNTGYTFGGWSITSGSGSFGSSTSTASNTFKPTANSTVTATFNETMSTVSFVASPTGKGTFQVGGSTVTSTTAGVTTTKSVTAVPISGYRFTGWSISGGATISSTSTNPTTITGKGAGAAATLTATFEEDVTYYTLTYGVASSPYNNGSISAKNASTDAAISSGASVLSGTNVTFTATPTNSHYKLKGWYSDASCNTAIAGAGTTNPYTKAISATQSVYAGFEIKTCAITLDRNGGTAGSTSVTATHGSTLPSFTAHTRSGYTLNGYYTAESGGTKVIDASGALVASTSYANASKQWNNDATTLTLYAQWTEKMTTITVNVSPSGAGTLTVGGSAFTPGNTTTAGVTTSRTVVATNANDYTFNNWTKSGNAAGSASTNTYTLKGNGSAGTGTLTANFTLIPVILLYGNTTPLNSPTTGSAMSYDATEHAYYIDVTTNSSPYYFRFDYNTNSEQYSGNWTSYPDVVEAVANGSKVDCNQTVKGWDNKGSIKYTGPNGTAIRIWFDYQNKKAWITEPTYTVSVTAGANGSVSPTSVSGVGASVASGDITATATTVGYAFSNWTLPSGVTAASGYSASSNPIRINATGSGKTITANFARTYAYIQGRMTVYNSARSSETHTASSKGGWDEGSTRIEMTYDATNHEFYRHTYKTPAELKAQISGYDQWFSIATSTTSGSFANKKTYHPSANQDLTAAGTQYAAQTSTTTYNYRFNNSTDDGYAIIHFNESKVWYTLEHTLKYDANGGTGSAPAGTTYYAHGVNATAAANTYTKDGYTFAGWKTGASSGTSYAAGASVPMNSNITLYAQWTAKTTTVSFNANTSAEGYASGSAPSNVTATYNADMPSISVGVVAQSGYACIGYFDDPVDGTQYYDGTGASTHKWDKDVATATLYAHYQKASITNLTLSPATQAPESSVTATATVGPTGLVGTTVVCWKFFYANGNPHTDPGFSPATGTSTTFTTPAASGTYKVAAILHLGSATGTVLDSVVADLVVAGNHEVTIQYMCGGQAIRTASVVQGRPLAWSDPITAPDITGYTFSSWSAGDGILIKNGDTEGTVTASSSPTIRIKANYDGVLTAVYVKKDIIYFYNTLGWTHVYAYFYSSDKYWDDSNGTGAQYDKNIGGTAAHYWHFWGEMTQIGNSNIYYFDYQAAAAEINPDHASEINGYTNVAFTKDAQGYVSESNKGYEFFYATEVVRRGDFNHAMPMFVPLAKANQPEEKKNSNTTYYYNQGYWMNYPDNTGYTLKVYNWYEDDEPAQEIRFPYSSDKKLPLKIDVELSNAAQERYWFSIYRNDGVTMGRDYRLHQDHHPDLRIGSSNAKIELMKSAPGIYTFTLTYYDDGTDGNQYHINVDFPIAVGDYRLKYTDNAKWSQSTAHSGSWFHPSDVIRKNTDDGVTKFDTVSLYIAKGTGITTSLKFQKVSSITVTNTDEERKTVVNWEDSAAITIPSAVVTEAGVYNFIIKQIGNNKPVLEKVEKYDGDFYIRTAVAGETGWDSYREDINHLMTYSDYAAANEGFTHYYAHWVDQGNNVKFCIANDYSTSISDTLIKDVDVVFDNMDNYGTLKTQGGVASYQSKYSANVRFMYNETTNKISRAYVNGSSNIANFIIMRSPSSAPKIYDSNGDPLAISGIDADAINLLDDENFIYENTIRVNPTTRIKLTANYCDVVQYFKGDADASYAEEHGMEILGGTLTDASTQKELMRIVYDFKTNRLVCAWLPSGNIDVDKDINADVMIIREHNNDAAQITFSEGKSLDEVKSVYGVMRFNRWILNNRANPEDKNINHSLNSDSISRYHPVLTSGQKSATERGLYWISFPFDVNLSDVFGLGTYGTHWIVMRYNSAERARIGWWQDTGTFWEYILDRRGVVLEAGMGYVLALDLELMAYNNSDFWANNIQQVELFFPSASSEIGKIGQTDVELDLPEYQCNQWHGKPANEGDPDYDRRIADSHWNLIGVPSYANYGSSLWDGSNNEITWLSNPKAQDLPFLYEWNATDNTYSVRSGKTYPFKTMFAYFVQYHGTLKWKMASAALPSSIARRSYQEAPQEVEFRLEIRQNDVAADQTYVKLSNDEEVSAEFIFNEDLYKEKNGGKTNIYTLVEGTTPAAGNTLPMVNTTTTVPVGVVAAANADYTFAIPDGTAGIGVTLVDTETGIRTSLSALDYTVNLPKGEYKDRFFLEISPIQLIPTDIEAVDEGVEKDGSRKVLIDNILYIIRNGKMFDARGTLVK